MDEPLAALDAGRKAEVLPFIAGLGRRYDLPILYVSHAMDEVLSLADTLVLMDRGQAVATGPVEDLLSRPDLRSLTGRGDAGSVVRAVVESHDAGHGVTRLTFAGGTLVSGRLALAVGSPVRVRIHARDIALALDLPTRISVRNILPGVVTAVTAAEGGERLIDVLLACNGGPRWARITELAQAQLGLAPGMGVHALIKAVTIARGDVAGR